MPRSNVEIEIRRARVEDAEDIARTHIASWRSTYRGIVSNEVLVKA